MAKISKIKLRSEIRTNTNAHFLFCIKSIKQRKGRVLVIFEEHQMRQEEILVKVHNGQSF